MSLIKRDCFAYNKENKDCDAFTELFCENKECKFYKEGYMKKIIAFDIKQYSEKRKHKI